MLYLKIRVNTIQIPTSTEIDHLWAEEAERRVQEVDNGIVELIPGEEVFKKITKKDVQKGKYIV